MRKDLTEIIKKIQSSIFYFVLVITLCGCDSSQVFHEYKPIANSEWSKEQAIHFDITTSDTISKNNIYIRLRNNNNYPFSTIFLISKMTFPNKKIIIDTLQYEMTDKNGKWLGTGFSNVKENKLFYKENVTFPQKGTYNFSIEQATRALKDIEGVKPLKGILDVGLEIEKQTNE